MTKKSASRRMEVTGFLRAWTIIKLGKTNDNEKGDNMTKNELRTGLKGMGYNCSFNTLDSPFSGGKAVTFVSLILPNGSKIQITSASVFGADFYAEHREAFKLVAEYKEGAGAI